MAGHLFVYLKHACHKYGRLFISAMCNLWTTKFAFAEELNKRGVKFWLRYVMLPGMTDGLDELDPMEVRP